MIDDLIGFPYVDGRFSTQNKMNLNRSRKNPNSNFQKIVRYLLENGPSRKVTVCRDVLGMKENQRWGKTATRGWGMYVWTLGRAYGVLNYDPSTRLWDVNRECIHRSPRN